MKRLALMTLVVLALASPVSAQSPEDLANDISQKVMSPFCPGVTLHDCPSQSALDMRDRIEGYARSGMSEAAIMDRLEAEYGDGDPGGTLVRGGRTGRLDPAGAGGTGGRSARHHGRSPLDGPWSAAARRGHGRTQAG